MAALVQNYFSQAPSAPEKSWVMLTEEAQRNTGKQADYLAWWRTVASANAQLVRWAPDTQTATVSYQLVMQNGARKTLSARLPIVRASTGELQISSLSG